MTAQPCDCGHLPRPSHQGQGSCCVASTGPYHIWDTGSALCCPLPHPQQTFVTQLQFRQRKTTGPRPQATACSWQALGDIHQPSYSFAPRPPQTPAPCPSHSSPHVLSRSYPSIKQKPCRESFFTCLSLWPKTLMKVEQILLAEVDQPIYWCPGPKSPRLVP